MKLTLGILAGISITLAGVSIWPDFIGWVFSDEPATHPDCKPRYWTSSHGVITRGEWT